MKHLICLLFSSLLCINCAKKQELNTITISELKELLNKEKIQLLDVRTPIEIERGSIKSSLFVNYFDEDFAIKATNKLDTTKPVYVFCRTGNRSRKAALILKEKGFEVYNVLGGYAKWKTEN